MTKGVVLLGTAQSWVDAPWGDLNLEIWGLNDGYMCRDAKGMGPRRASRWYELHPFEKMWFRPKDQRTVYSHQVPEGAFVRPEGHLEWLKEQARTIPVYLKDAPPVDWPANAYRFPVEEMDRRFGIYWASGPSYMVAQAIVEQRPEIHVYGIHLATQAEYVEQRPNFEHMLGLARGLGIKVVMSEKSPLLKHGWRYAYEPRPAQKVPEALTAARKEIKAVREEKSTLTAKLVTWPRFRSKTQALARLEELSVLEADLAQQINRHHTQSAVIALGG